VSAPPPPSAAALLALADGYFQKHFELSSTSSAPDFATNTARGVHLLERALAAARAAGSAKEEYQALAMLGIYHSNMQRLPDALDYYARARATMAAHPEIDWQHRPAMNANNTSGVLRKMGRASEVVEWLERSRADFERCGRAANVIVAYGYLGEAYREAGRLDDSRGAYERGLALAVEIGERGEIPWLEWGLGETHARRGERAAALAAFARAERIFTEANEPQHLPPLCRAAWKVAREAGEEALAARWEQLLFAGAEAPPPAAEAPGGPTS
jgi:tetratricopeptide (TPR) repeat protein